MLGPLLALIGALFFSFSNISARRALVRVEDTSAGVAVSVIISLPFLFLALVITGKVGDILLFPWHGYLWLLGAGIINYYVGRSLSYIATQWAGANIAGILRRSSPLVAVSLGVLVLGEVVTGKMLMGILLIVAGVVFLGWNPWQSPESKTSVVNLSIKGILIGVGAGVCYGLSSLMIKMGLNSFSSPLAAVFIAYAGAAVIHALLHIKGDKRNLLLTMDNRTFWFFFLTGLLVVSAHIFSFFALSMAPIVIISPIFSINPLGTIALSFIFNRKLEVFSKSVIISAAAVVVGSFLLLWY